MPNYEKKVYAELVKRKVTAYLPLQTAVRQWSDRSKSIQMALFPNYIFVQPTQENIWPTLGITGIIRYISFEGKLARVKDAEIRIVQQLLSSGYKIANEEAMAEGDEVKIIDGPLTGLTGIISSRQNQKKIYVQINAINKIISAEIFPCCLQKVLSNPSQGDTSRAVMY